MTTFDRRAAAGATSSDPRRRAADGRADGTTAVDPGLDATTTAAATGWFEPLYAAAARGERAIPWDHGAPNPVLAAWLDTPPAGRPAAAGSGRSRPGRALVIGCGLGRDAELVAGHGYATTAFDVAPTAIALARRRTPGSAVDYVVADLFDPPAGWLAGFDVVVETNTVQALPRSLRAAAAGRVACLVAPGGRLVVAAAALAADRPADAGPPWPLTRDEVDGFATGGLAAVRVERLASPSPIATERWLAEFAR